MEPQQQEDETIDDEELGAIGAALSDTNTDNSRTSAGSNGSRRLSLVEKLTALRSQLLGERARDSGGARNSARNSSPRRQGPNNAAARSLFRQQEPGEDLNVAVGVRYSVLMEGENSTGQPIPAAPTSIPVPSGGGGGQYGTEDDTAESLALSRWIESPIDPQALQLWRVSSGRGAVAAVASAEEDSRRQSQIRTDAIHAFKEYKKFTPDCGARGRPQHLSLARALEVGSNLSVGAPNDHGGKDPLPLSTDLGWYRLPGERAKEPLEECGPGIVMYFKLLKGLALLFALMTALTLPALVMYLAANTSEPVQRAYAQSVDSQQLLSYTTLGSLGEPVPSCRRVDEGQVFAFRCPASGTVRSLVSYYGQPRGSCGCPRVDEPVAPGVCNGTRSGAATQQQVLSDRLNYKGQQCVPNAQGQVLPCFLGSTRYDSQCCSATLDAGGYADLSNLDLGLNTTCNSYTAPFILEALCLGSDACALPVSLSQTVTFPVASLRNASLAASVCASVTAGGMCVTDLSHGGVFSGCDSAVNNYLFFEGICFTSALPATDNYGSLDHTNAVFASSLLDAVSIIVFLLGVGVMRFCQDEEERQQDKAACRASDYTVVCYTIPSHTDHSDLVNKLRSHFEEVLSRETPIHYDERVRVADINVGSGCYEYLQAAVTRGDRARDIDKVLMKLVARLKTGDFAYTSFTDMALLNKLKAAMHQYETVNALCTQMQYRAAAEVNRVYVTFETEEGVLRCLRAYSSRGVLDPFYQRTEQRIEGRPVILKRSIDPSDIVWENIGVPRWSRVLRVLVTSSVTLGLLAISYVMIFEALSLSQTAGPGRNFSNIACSTYTASLNRDAAFMGAADANTITYQDVLYDHNWQAYNASNYGSQGYLLCYCQQINFEKGAAAMRDYPFYNAMTGREEAWCRTLTTDGYYAQLASYGATFIIIAINVSLHQVLKTLAVLECHTSDTAEVISVACKLVLAQYINTGLLSLIIYGDLTNLGVSNVFLGASGGIVFGFFTGTFKDFTAAWYVSVGSSLLFTMCLFMLGSQVLIVLRIALKRLEQLWDQRVGSGWVSAGCVRRDVTHCDLQVELEQLYLKIDFPFDRQLSSAATVVFVTMTYSAGMPLMNAVCCVSLLLLYACNKVSLLRFHSLPPSYSVDLIKVVTRLLYFSALLHCVFGAWMFGNNNLYAPDLHYSQRFVSGFLVASHSWHTAVDWLPRVTGRNSVLLLGISLALLAVMALYLATLVLYALFGLYSLEDWLLQTHQSWLRFRNMERRLPPYFAALPLPLLHSRLSSGAVVGRLREKYREQLGKLLTHEAELPEKQLEGLESYKLSLSTEYAYKFGLDSFYMRRAPPRDWLISKEAKADLLFLETALNGGRRNSMRGSFTHLLRQSISAQDTFDNHAAYETQINQILAYCSPLRTEQNKVRRRSLNSVFFLGQFNNDAQQGEPVYRPSASAPSVDSAGRDNRVQSIDL